ncbi:hypothetical protein CTAYLR_008417 [Chrysophaeum taylorii]|uniref:5'-Nucleotidase C-terminal domain-containing protein n=1 Tax=Chrysophaeum taylorii TaxID=2483200 RepID=A0AAD7UKR0_9STRA|nr:hypothetical protein CTAYLR_008417 [Chrysophaeum taylorii]
MMRAAAAAFGFVVVVIPVLSAKNTSTWRLEVAVMGRLRGRFLPNNPFGSLAEPGEVNLTDGSALLDDGAVYGGPARIAGAVEELRMDPSKNVLFVDMGGFYYTNLWYRYDVLETAIGVYEKMGVDVAACDNWDFYSCEQTCETFGNWVDKLGNLSVPVVGANLDAEDNEYLRGRVAPWTVLNASDQLQVGVIGLVDTDLVQRIGGALAPDVSARSARTWSNREPYDGDDVATAIRDLEASHPACKIIILLVGELNADDGPTFFEYMYAAYPSLDVIVSYEPWVGVEELARLRVGGLSRAYVRATLAATVTGSDTSSAMTVASLDFDDRGMIVNASVDQLHLGEGTPLKKDAWDVVVASLDETYAALEENVGFTHIFLDGERSLDETATGPQALGCYRPDCSLGRVAALADLALCGDCDFSLENGGVVRASIPAGNTSRPLRFSVELSGAAVLDLLDHAVTQVFDYQQCDQLVPGTCGGPGQLACVEGACELHGGIPPQFAGLRWAFNAPYDLVLSAEVYSRHDDSWYPIDPAATYKVATNSFIMSGGNEYDVFLERGENLETLPVGQVQAIIDFISANSPLYHGLETDAVKTGQPIFEAGVGEFAECEAFETTDGYARVALPARAPETDNETAAIDAALADARARLFPYAEVCATRITLDAESASSTYLVAQLEDAVANVDAECPSGRSATAVPLAWVVNVQFILGPPEPLSRVAGVEELDADFGLVDIVSQVDSLIDSSQTCFLAPDAQDMADAVNAVIDNFAWTQVLFLYTDAYSDHLDLFKEKAKAGLFVSSALLDADTVAEDTAAALAAFPGLRIIIIMASIYDVAKAYAAASDAGALEGYAYLYTVRPGDDAPLDTVGALVIQKLSDNPSYLHDATWHAAATISDLVDAYRRFDEGDDTVASFHELPEKTTLLRRYAMSVEFDGRSGNVDMITSGTCSSCCQRQTRLAVSSVTSPGTIAVIGEWLLDGQFFTDQVTVWPGNVTDAPIGGATECDPGFYYRPDDATCVACDLGQRVNADETSCEDCPAGRFRDSDGTECRYCDVNLYQDETGQAQCKQVARPCPENTDRSQAESEFHQDPANEGIDVAVTAASIRECQCLVHYYSSVTNGTVDAATEFPTTWGETGKPCKACSAPPGLRAKARRIHQSTKPGTTDARALLFFYSSKKCDDDDDDRYWGFPDSPDEFYECDGGDVCKEKYACHKGLKRNACSYLKKDYFEISGYPTPIDCPRKRRNRIAVLVVSATCVLVFWFVVNAIIVQQSVTMTIFLDNIQVVAIITAGVGSVHFPTVVDIIDPIFQLLLFDVDVVSPNCVHRWRPFEGFVLQLALALVCFLVLAVVWVYQAAVAAPATRVKRRLGPSESLVRLASRRIRWAYSSPPVSRAVARAFSMVELTYPTVTINCFEAMRCKSFADGDRYLVYDINIKCGSRRHATLRALAILATAIVVFGVPHFVFVAVWRELRMHFGVHRANFQERFGFAVRDFRSPFFTWKLVLSYRFVGICVASALVEHSSIQLSWISLVMALVTVLHWTYLPFKNSRLNLLEGLGCALCLAYAISLNALEHETYREAWAVACVLGLCVFSAATLYNAVIDAGIAHARFKSLVRVLFDEDNVYETFKRHFRSRRKKIALARLPTAVVVEMKSRRRRRWHDNNTNNNNNSAEAEEELASSSTSHYRRATEETPLQTLEDFLLALARHRFIDSADSLFAQLLALKRKVPPPGPPELAPDYYLTLLERAGVEVSRLSATDLASYMQRIQPSLLDPVEQSMSHVAEFAILDRASRVVRDMMGALDAAPTRDWMFHPDRTDEDFKLVVSTAQSVQLYVSNDAPIGPLSVDWRSEFWRQVVDQNPGILNIVAYELTADERNLFYSVLVRLQKSTRDAHAKIEAKHHPYFLSDLIVEEHRSTILYFMLASPPEETSNFVDLMTQIARTRDVHHHNPDHWRWRDLAALIMRGETLHSRKAHRRLHDSLASGDGHVQGALFRLENAALEGGLGLSGGGGSSATATSKISGFDGEEDSDDSCDEMIYIAAAAGDDIKSDRA